MTVDIASWNFSRKWTSNMQVSSGRPHMLTSNQRGLGQEPVTVAGRIRSAVAVNMTLLLFRGLRRARGNRAPKIAALTCSHVTPKSTGSAGGMTTDCTGDCLLNFFGRDLLESPPAARVDILKGI